MPSRRRFLAGACGAGILASSGCLSGPEPYYDGEEEPDTEWWTQSEFDRIGSCYNPRPVGPTGEVRERWRLDISGPAARPVVADGLAFLPTATAVRAVDAATGEEVWRENGGDSPMWPYEVCWFDGTLYAAQGGDPALFALDAATGDRLWTFSPDGFSVYALLVDPERPTLFAGDDEGNVYALDPATGEVRWHRGVFGAVTHFAQAIPELLVGTRAGEVYGLYPGDGQGLWRRKLPGHVTALATANGESAFASVFGGPTFALRGERTGKTAWTADAWGADSFVVAGRSLLSAGRRLVALDVRSGDRQWTGGKTTQCGPAAAGDTVYAASVERVTAYDFSGGVGIGSFRIGAKRWSYPVEGRPEQGLVVADGAVFLLTEGSEGSSKAYALEGA